MRILYLEPFHGGSHAAFTKTLTENIDAEWRVLTLPGRHWKWRMRVAAPYFALEHRDALTAPTDLLFASSYVALAELYGLVPALKDVPSILYFHENQLTYPNRHDEARDHHFGFTQLVSALAATACWFNSAYNRDGFLNAARALLDRMPDAVPTGMVDQVEAKSRIMPVPLVLPEVAPHPTGDPPLVLWNHRWEHDKDPEAFFDAIGELAERGARFELAVCGKQYKRSPPIFEEARKRFADRIVHFGEADRETYEALLARADVVVSTARHEYFGIAVLEATHFGAYPLVPDDLAYPEIFADEHRYPRGRLAEALGAVLARNDLAGDRSAITARFGQPLLDEYKRLFRSACQSR